MTPSARRIRVMIVEDSLTVRLMLEHVVSTDPRLEVAYSASSAEEALKMLDRVAPDVISLDIRLPGMNGLEATMAIMSRRPTPIVVIAGDVDSDELDISMNALRAGALSVLEKPSGPGGDPEHQALEIREQLVAMSSVRVVRQRLTRNLTFAKGGPDPRAPEPGRARTLPPARPFDMLGVVASTGGPQAIVRVLQALPSDYPLPILLVQHITHGFLETFMQWLGQTTPFEGRLARDLEYPLPGRIYAAPEDTHLEVSAGGLLRVTSGPAFHLQRPSGTVLFRSMARSLGQGALGVLLTGMGEDGAEGLLSIRQAGGYTITEDESTAVVYGMPAVAARIGGSCESLPVGSIARRVLELTSAPEARHLRAARGTHP